MPLPPSVYRPIYHFIPSKEEILGKKQKRRKRTLSDKERMKERHRVTSRHRRIDTSLSSFLTTSHPSSFFCSSFRSSGLLSSAFFTPSSIMSGCLFSRRHRRERRTTDSEGKHRTGRECETGLLHSSSTRSTRTFPLLVVLLHFVSRRFTVCSLANDNRERDFFCCSSFLGKKNFLRGVSWEL